MTADTTQTGLETSLSLRSIEFDCDWKGGGGEEGKEAAEDDGKGQLEIHELD